MHILVWQINKKNIYICLLEGSVSLGYWIKDLLWTCNFIAFSYHVIIMTDSHTGIWTNLRKFFLCLDHFWKSGGPQSPCNCLGHVELCHSLKWGKSSFSSVQFSSVAQLCPTLCDPMNHSMPGLPVHQQLPEFTQTHVHRVGDAIQPSHPLSSLSPPARNPSQHQSLFQWVNSVETHEVATVLELQL